MSNQPSLARGAAVITVATGISRITGFFRVMAVAAAMGTTFLANVYQTANTVPNVLFELLAAGVLTSIFVPTFVDYVVKDAREEGWEAANALTSIALVALVGLSVVLGLTAPFVMRLLTLGVRDQSLRDEEIRLGTSLLRLFAPQIAFYGLGMIMTGALHAHRRFAMAAIAPIFNNVVVIAVYLTYAAMQGGKPPTIGGTSTAEMLLLGLGTTLGVVAMTLCLVPQLRRLGWRFRFRPARDHPAVKRAARVGVWALGYAGGYQAGLIVVILLANKVRGGLAAYQWAYTFFYLPHALFAVPIFNVLFTAMSEHVSRDERGELLTRLRDGLAMLAFIMLPLSAFLAAAAGPLARTTLRYGVMTGAGADHVARVLEALAVGLPTYSAFLVFTRAFYALGDAKTPALLNALSVAAASVTGVVLFFAFPNRLAVQGLALGHSIGFALGTFLLARTFRRRFGTTGGTKLAASVLRIGAATAVALVLMVVVGLLLNGPGRLESLISLLATAVCGAAAYLLVMKWAEAPELDRALALVRRTAG